MRCNVPTRRITEGRALCARRGSTAVETPREPITVGGTAVALACHRRFVACAAGRTLCQAVMHRTSDTASHFGGQSCTTYFSSRRSASAHANRTPHESSAYHTAAVNAVGASISHVWEIIGTCSEKYQGTELQPVCL
jgi:hypothetical protein